MVERTFVNAIGWNLVGSFARIGVTLVCQLVLLRMLGPEPAGHFALFLFVVGIGAILAEGGMAVVIARAADVHPQLLRNAQFLILCYASAVTFPLMAFTPVFLRLFHMPPTDWFVPTIAALNVVPLALTSVPVGLLKRQHRAREIQLIQITAYILGFGFVAIPLAYAYRSVIVLVCAFSFQTLVALALALLVSRCPLIPHWRGASDIRRASSRAVLVNIAGYINESLPNVAIAHLLGATAVGIYSTSFNLLRTPTDVIASSLHGPLLTSSARRSEGTESRTRYLSTLNILATTVIAVYVIVFLCGDYIAVPLLGAKWLSAGPVLSIVALIMAARLIGGISGAVIWGQGRLWHDLLAQAVAVAILLLGVTVVAPTEIEIVAWIVCISGAVRAAIHVFAASDAVNARLVDVFNNLISPALITSAFMLPLLWIGDLILPTNGILGLLTFGMIAAMILSARICVAWRYSSAEWAILGRAKLMHLRRRRTGQAEALLGNQDMEPRVDGMPSLDVYSSCEKEKGR